MSVALGSRVSAQDAVWVAVVADGQVEVVGGAAAADNRVELLAGHQLVDQAMGGVCGDALGSVDGGSGHRCGPSRGRW
jgi:hypothetical protein